MKKFLKSITAVMLIAVIAIGAFHTDTVYAAKKTPPLKITFNGKSLNLIKVQKDGNEKIAAIKTIEKAFGAPDEKKKIGTDTRYNWKKGKSTFGFSQYKTDSGEKGLWQLGATLNNKNDALCGIKIGMDGKKAAEKLIKMYGKKNVFDVSKIPFEDGTGYTSKYKKGKAIGDCDSIAVQVYSSVLGVHFELKDGRVSAMGISG